MIFKLLIKKKHIITYKPADYLDWLKFFNDRYSQEVYRYLCEKYIKLETEDNIDLDELDLSTQKIIIDKIFEKSEFNVDKIDTSIIKDNIHSYYDIFIGIHAGLPFLLEFLKMDFKTRVYYINLVQTLVGIDVQKRIDVCNKLSIPVNLESNDQDFNTDINKMNSRTGKSNINRNIHNHNVDSNDYSSILREAIKRDKVNPIKIDPFAENEDFRRMEEDI